MALDTFMSKCFSTARVMLILFWLLAGATAWAGQYRLLVGQPNRVPVGIEVRNAETLCNVEIRINGGPPIQQRVSAPDFMAWLVLTPQQSGVTQVSWRGVFYRNTKDELVNPCPVMGQTRFMASQSHADLGPAWQAFWVEREPRLLQCLKDALQLQSMRTEGFDLQDPVPSVMDKVLARSEQQCERFLQIKRPWGSAPTLGHDCVIGGLKTRCDGFYTSPGGKGPRLNEVQALAKHLAGEPLVAVHAESMAVQQARARAIKAAADKALAEENAKIEAFKMAMAEQKAREEAERQARLQAEEAERQRKIKAAEAREREWLENRPWLVRKLSRIQPKPLEEQEQAQGEPPKKQP